ncbi:MAG: hypothetical protein OEW39_05565, partial [Deltaproteobacteria bacterium]|nr:hypothetical protein [Deltaproteobacteria bacterium]
MDAAKHSRTRPYFRSGAGLLLVLCAALAFQVPAKAQQAAATVITGLQLRKEGDRLELHFQTSRPTPFLIIGNPVRQVVVVKFPQALPAFRDNQRYFVFNDPYLVGLAFEDISEGGTWAKIRLRTSRLDYKAGSPSPSNQVVLSFSPRTGPLMSELLDVKLQREGNASRVLLELSSIPPFVEQPESNVFILRMRSVNSRLTRPPRASDEQVALGAVERDGEDTLVSVVLKQPNLRANVFTMPERSRIVVDFRPMGPLPEAQETKSPAKAAAKSNGPVAPGPKDPVELLLELEENPLIRANYLLGESELRGGNYQRAADVFLRVFDSSTKSRLGVRAYQRAADALFELRVSQGAKNFHDVIVTYQSAI